MKNFYSNPIINSLANEITKYMPTLADYFASKESLKEYSERINNYRPNLIHLERQKLFKESLNTKIKRIFNEEELKKINLGIDDDWGVVGGIVEHHGILDHPLLLSVSLVSNFYKLLDRNKNGDVLVFATGNIPLGEPFRKRGFTLNGKKYNLYPKSYKNKVVYGLQKYNFDLKDRIIKAHEWHLLNEKEQGLLEKVNKIINTIDFSTCETLSDQITKINFYLWPYLFEEKIRTNCSNLVSIEYDDVVIEYLIHVIKNDKESHVYKMLFDENFRKYIMEEFSGKQGAWDEEKETGSHFFWALDEDNERIRLEFKDGKLIGKNIEIKLEPDAIIEALKEKRILPVMLLKFALIVFYMGMKPLMGYSLEYMTRLRSKMIEVLEKYFPDEAERVKSIPYDNMNLISVCKGKDEKGILKDLHAFDIFLRGGFDKKYFDILNSIPFKDFLVPSLLFAYNYSFGKFRNIQSVKKDYNISEDELQESFKNFF